VIDNMIYKKVLFPLLRQMDAETAHEHILSLLFWAQTSALGRAGLRLLAGRLPQRAITIFGLRFPNVLGMAAGFDKNGRVAAGLAMLGFGHVEVGTLTPWPQMGNLRPRLFRLPADEALINRLGFPNEGVEAAVSHLSQLKKRSFILGVSLGKQKETPLTEAAADYIAVMQAVYPHADYLAVNISSPNTPGLRDLQGGRYLRHLLAALQQENGQLAQKHGVRQRPLLVKISPDLIWPELDEIVIAVQDNDISGIIATNTTISRVGLVDARRAEQGGLSGRPLGQRSTEVIAYIQRQTNGNLPVIGVGGIRTAVEAKAKLDAGAALVQLYTGLIYEGPRLAGRILRGLERGYNV
jgi:dihydroorotate dehydrogenase